MQMRFRGQPVEVTAIQWTGENLAAVQAFLAPLSPAYYQTYAHAPVTLYVPVPDVGTRAQYPTLSAALHLQAMVVGAWIVQLVTGEFAVVSEGEFAQRFVPITGSDERRPLDSTAPLGTWPATATHPRVVEANDPRNPPDSAAELRPLVDAARGDTEEHGGEDFPVLPVDDDLAF